jgi:hypothetical protein
LVLEKPDFDKECIIYKNSTEEEIITILLQKDDQNNNKKYSLHEPKLIFMKSIYHTINHVPTSTINHVP